MTWELLSANKISTEAGALGFSCSISGKKQSYLLSTILQTRAKPTEILSLALGLVWGVTSDATATHPSMCMHLVYHFYLKRTFLLGRELLNISYLINLKIILAAWKLVAELAQGLHLISAKRPSSDSSGFTISTINEILE